MKMSLSFLLSLVFLLQPCVVSGDSCPWENVSGAEGGEVILRVPQERIRFINWILLPEGNLIVITKPGESINDEDVRTQYRGRLRSDTDGSLHIYNLSLQDQRIYKADIQGTPGICVRYNLTVYERLSPGDLRISRTITRNDTCSPALLCSVDKPDVTITWSNINSSDVNVTRGVLYVPPSDVNYTYICIASNPVSKVYKTVIPKTFCERDSSFIRRNQKDLSTINILRLILSGIVLLITGGVFIHHIRTEVIKPPGGD